MISILIPVFNNDVCALVHELSRQLNTASIKGEIIVFDDCSDIFFRQKNQSLSLLTNVFYKEMEKNVGRIEIRKLLSVAAVHDWLLFIDSDSRIVSDNYLQSYVRCIQQSDTDAVVGGRIYQNTPPEECSKRLHWKYGKKREQRKGIGFQSNNFCVRKNSFSGLSFPAGWKNYGHEDTWIGIQFERLGKKIHFLKNPVLHEGIEEANIFLEKNFAALQNLVLLSNLTDQKLLRKHVRLYNVYCYQKKPGFSFLTRIVYLVLKKTIRKNLVSCNPSLACFDFLRLCLFIELKNKQA